MAGPQDLQVFPPGFLSGFGIKNGGKNPQTMGQTLIPVVELRDWYLAQARQYIRGTTADIGAAAGFQPVLAAGTSVPQNQAYWISNIASGPNGNLAAGNAYRWQIAKLPTSSSFGQALSPYVSLAAGQSAQATFQGPILLLPGDTIGILIGDLTHALAQPWQFYADVTVLNL